MKKISLQFEACFIFLAALALFCYGIFSRELIGFETRFAVFAKEMLWYGPTFFPVTYGQPYPDYPAGLPFLNFAFAKLFGHFNTFVAILPCALASAGTLTFLFKALAPYQRDWARITVLLCLFTYGFMDGAKTLGTDPLVMFAASWAFYISLKQIQKNQYYFLWLSLPLIFGFCIRGPIGLIIPTAVVVATLAGHNQWRCIIRFGTQALILLITLMALLLLAAWHQGGKHFIKDVLVMQILGRLDDDRTHNFFAYFTYSFGQYAISYELAIVSVALFSKHFFHSQSPISQLLRSFLLWVLLILIGMSIPEVRKIRYVLPMVPALAALAAYLWITTITHARARIAVKVMNIICLALPFILIVLTLATLIVTKLKHLEISAHYNSAFFCLFILCLMSIYVLLHKPFEYADRNPKKVIGIGLASFFVILVFITKPIEVSHNRNDWFVNPVVSLLKPNQNIIFYQVNLDAEPIQFVAALKSPLTVLYSDYIDTNHSNNAIYITTTGLFAAIPEDIKPQLEVVQQGRLGHKQMVAFRAINHAG